MSRPRVSSEPLIVKAIRIDKNTDKFFKKRGLNLSMVCRRLLYELMNMKEIPQTFYFEKYTPEQKSIVLKKYEHQ